MPRLAGRLWSWLPVLAWMALILLLSGQSDLPARTNPRTGETIRTTFAAAKLAHVVEYSILGLLLLRGLTHPTGGARLPMRTAIVAAVLASAAFGGLDELRQSFVPNREPRLSDVVLDTASALAALLAVTAWRRFRSLRPASASRSPASAPPRPRAGEVIGG